MSPPPFFDHTDPAQPAFRLPLPYDVVTVRPAFPTA